MSARRPFGTHPSSRANPGPPAGHPASPQSHRASRLNRSTCTPPCSRSPPTPRVDSLLATRFPPISTPPKPPISSFSPAMVSEKSTQPANLTQAAQSERSINPERSGLFLSPVANGAHGTPPCHIAWFPHLPLRALATLARPPARGVGKPAGRLRSGPRATHRACQFARTGKSCGRRPTGFRRGLHRPGHSPRRGHTDDRRSPGNRPHSQPGCGPRDRPRHQQIRRQSIDHPHAPAGSFGSRGGLGSSPRS